jgi:hypothetical protein
MSDRSTRDTDPALAAALADLAVTIEFPLTPVLSTVVAAEIRQPARARWAWSRPVLGRSLGRSLVLGAAAAILVVGAAGAIGLGLGALRISFVGDSPLPTPVGSVPNRGYGQPTTLAEAQQAVPFAIRLPAIPTLGKPDAVYLATVPATGTVTLAWGDRAGYPADADGIGLVVTEFEADIGPATFEKMILEGTAVQPVSVNGVPGWWVEGGTHFFFYRDAGGEIVETTIRLVGSALFWDEEGLVIRVEGAPNLEAAMKVAASLE